MGQRGPTSPGQKRTRGKTTKISADCFAPEKGMSAQAKNIWKALVGSMPVGYFKEADRPQLRGFCEASARLAKAAREINKKNFEEVYTDDKGVMRKNPWLDVYKDNLALVNSTSTKLRISKSTQISPKAAGRAADDAEQAQALGHEASLNDLMFNGKAN